MSLSPKPQPKVNTCSKVNTGMLYPFQLLSLCSSWAILLWEWSPFPYSFSTFTLFLAFYTYWNLTHLLKFIQVSFFLVVVGKLEVIYLWNFTWYCPTHISFCCNSMGFPKLEAGFSVVQEHWCERDIPFSNFCQLLLNDPPKVLVCLYHFTHIY